MTSAAHSQAGKVFISYKREERDLALLVRQKLAALEVQFFMDLELTPDGDYGSRLDQYLVEASAVLVLWTNLSKASEFVRSEAQKGFNRGALVAARFDNLAVDDLSVPFNRFHTSDLSDWRATGASGKHPEWQSILEALGRKLGRPGLPHLAAALESGTDIAKRAFLRVHPDDPAAAAIASQLEALERQEFEKRMTAARTRIARREREIEKRLNATRDAFELSLQDLRAGRDYMPPDPVNSLNDNVAKLREQVEIGEAALNDLRSELEQTQQKLRDEESKIGPALRPQVRKGLIAAAAVLGLTIGAASAWGLLNSGDHGDSQIAARARALDVREAGLKSLGVTEELLNRRDAVLAKREGELVAAKKALDIRDGENGKAKAALDQREATLVKRETDFAAAQKLLAGREDELNRRGETLARNEQALASRTSGLTDRERDVARREDDLKKSSDERTRRAEDQIKSLQAQLTQLQNREAALDGRAKTAEREREALFTQLAQKQKEAGEKDNQLQAANATIAVLNSRASEMQKELTGLKTAAASQQFGTASPPAQQQPRPVEAAGTAKFVSDCDRMTAYKYDPDRPANSEWKDRETEISTDAQSVCQKGLQGSTDKVVRRRILAQMGRILLAQSKRSTGSEAKGLAEKALARWNEAAGLDSGQAFVALAAYYMGQKDYQKAWENYEKAAERKNPVGQTHAAQFLLFPEYFSEVVNRDDVRGRKYLEAATAAGYPRTLYAIGDAKRAGRGWQPEDPDGGRLLIEQAFCMGDTAAKDFFQRSKKHKPPTCQSSLLR